MKAKDTILSDEKIENLYQEYQPILKVEWCPTVLYFALAVAQAQAEISLPAGAKAVVKLAVEKDVLCPEQRSNDCVVCRNFYTKLHEELDGVSSPPPKHSRTTPS